MIATQLADFLNNTMIPQYLGKEAIKAEDLSPIVSVGATTTVYQPPVEPTKVASMKTTDYTTGTATIVNTEGNTSFVAKTTGAGLWNSSYETETFTLAQCITQETGGIGIKLTGNISYPVDFVEDNYIMCSTVNIAHLLSLPEGTPSALNVLASGFFGVADISDTITPYIEIMGNRYNNISTLTVRTSSNQSSLAKDEFYVHDWERGVASFDKNNGQYSINIGFSSLNIATSDPLGDMDFMLISTDDYITICINDIVVCSVLKSLITADNKDFMPFIGTPLQADNSAITVDGVIKEFEIFQINEE